MKGTQQQGWQRALEEYRLLLINLTDIEEKGIKCKCPWDPEATFFFLSGDQSKSFHFVSITASSSHTSADSTKWINSEHWCDSKSSLLTFR